jgi:hypothetical protein
MVFIPIHREGVALKKCQICGQKADVYTTTHKKEPFVDGRNYDIVCFTCCFVPKVLEQKYSADGFVSEEIALPYSCENLYSPREIYNSGSSDSIRQAKVCFEAVSKVCLKALKGKSSKSPRSRPKASWNVS